MGFLGGFGGGFGLRGGTGTPGIPSGEIQRIREYAKPQVYQPLTQFYAQPATVSSVKNLINFLPDIQQISTIRGQVNALVTDVRDNKNNLLSFAGDLGLAHRRVSQLTDRVRDLADCIDRRAIAFAQDRGVRAFNLVDQVNSRIQKARERMEKLRDEIDDLTNDRFSLTNMDNRFFNTTGSRYYIEAKDIYGATIGTFGPLTPRGLHELMNVYVHGMIWVITKGGMAGSSRNAAVDYLRSNFHQDIRNMLTSEIYRIVQEPLSVIRDAMNEISGHLLKISGDIAAVSSEFRSPTALKPRCTLGVIEGGPGEIPSPGISIGATAADISTVTGQVGAGGIGEVGGVSGPEPQPVSGGFTQRSVR